MNKSFILFLFAALCIVADARTHADPISTDGNARALDATPSVRPVQTPYLHVREMLARGEIEAAEAETNRLITLEPSNATLQLYQTGILIEKADRAYKTGRMRTALEIYERAHRAWPSHPVVRQRIMELKTKSDLRDEVPAPLESRNRPVSMAAAPGNMPASTGSVSIYILDASKNAQANELERLIRSIRTAGETSESADEWEGSPPDHALQDLIDNQTKLSRKLDIVMVFLAGGFGSLAILLGITWFKRR